MPRYKRDPILVRDDRRKLINAIAEILRLITGTAIGGAVGAFILVACNNPQWDLGRNAGLLFGLSLQVRSLAHKWEDSE